MKSNVVKFISFFAIYLVVVILSDMFIFQDFEFTTKYILGKVFVGVIFSAIAIPVGNAVIKRVKSK